MSVRKGRPRTVSRAEDPPANGQPQLRVRVSREAAAWVQSQGGPSFLRGLILGVMACAQPTAHTEQSSVMRHLSGTYPDLPDKRPSDGKEVSSALLSTPSLAPENPTAIFTPAPTRWVNKRKPPVISLHKGENNG